MGTPEFAVPSLDILVNNNFQLWLLLLHLISRLAEAGKYQFLRLRNMLLKNRSQFCSRLNLKDTGFVENIKSYQADLNIVVAFRMLPEVIWKMPSKGTFNLHASLLPQYRGAAPINWAIINGEKETGITTFFIDEKIDTGRIILSEKVKIEDSETAGELHDRLMFDGADLVLRTVNLIREDRIDPTAQDDMMTSIQDLKPAPKIFKKDTRINWEKPVQEVFNLIRGLSPYPGAFTNLIGIRNRFVVPENI